MSQQLRGQANADDSRQTDGQPHPADGIDRLPEKSACHQGHQQRLAINQDGTETRSCALQPPCQKALKQSGIHQGEQEEPKQITGIDRQATAGPPAPEQKSQTGGHEAKASNQPGPCAGEQWRHGGHRRSPERKGQHHQEPESQ